MITSRLIESSDGLKLHLVCWKTDKPPVGIIQISHGMAEHILRYERFAQNFNQLGYWVYGHDHRGHGESINETIGLGSLGVKHGWDLLVSDLNLVTEHIQNSHPNTPIILFGHSMGSFALRDYLCRYNPAIKGAVICGTGDQPNALLKVAALIARIESKLLGSEHPSTLLTKLSFGNYNRAFSPAKTDFDWLSTNEMEVNKYISDSLCGITFSSGFYDTFLSGVLKLKKREAYVSFRNNTRYLFISGEDDPLSEKGRAIKRVYNRYKSGGASEVSMTIFEGMRHELINEIHADRVEELIYSWIVKI